MRWHTSRIAATAVLTVVLASFLLPGTTWAAPEDDAKATAKAKLVEGGELLKQGEYASALGRFQEAYELVRSPKIQYNFGLAYMGLGRKADAVEAFEKFLAEATDANPDLRANAERHRSTLSQQVGTLIVECDADGAEVAVDGRARGVTPLPQNLPIRLDPGPHQLVVEKAGVPPFAEKVTAVAGRRTTLQAHLAVPAPPVARSEPEPPSGPVVTPPVPPAVPEISPEERRERTRAVERKLAWGTGAAAVAGLGLGLVERLVANGKFSDFNTKDAAYGKCDTDDRVREHGGPGCDDLLSAGRSAQSLSTVGLIAGGALGVVSGVLFYLSRPESGTPTSGPPASGTAAAAASLACLPDLAAPAGLVCAARF